MVDGWGVKAERLSRLGIGCWSGRDEIVTAPIVTRHLCFATVTPTPARRRPTGQLAATHLLVGLIPTTHH